MALADYLDSIPQSDLIAVLKCMESILRENLQNDRICIPAIDAIAGLCEENIFTRIANDYEYPPPQSRLVWLIRVFGLCSFLLRRLGINLRM